MDGNSQPVTAAAAGRGHVLLRRGRLLEGITLAWNVVGIAVLAVYLTAQSAVVLAAGYHPGPSALGIAWTAVTSAAMFALATGKSRTGRALGSQVLITEGRVTLVDGILALAVLAGLALDAAAGLWWADPLAALVIVFYALREAREIFLPAPFALRSTARAPGAP